jgi:glycosyltransferase involved in cell wall biosynthesis
MKEKNEISVIIPVFNANEELLNRAIVSVASQKETPDALI